MRTKNEKMEMPTPCIHCGETFELNDGYESEKWHENTTICSSCHYLEETEIEDDELWEDINNEISDALYYLEKKEKLLERLSQENKNLILSISKLLSGSEV